MGFYFAHGQTGFKPQHPMFPQALSKVISECKRVSFGHIQVCPQKKNHNVKTSIKFQYATNKQLKKNISVTMNRIKVPSNEKNAMKKKEKKAKLVTVSFMCAGLIELSYTHHHLQMLLRE